MSLEDPSARDCFSVRQQISVELEGESSDADWTAIQKHLDGCPGCRRHAQELKGLMHLLRISKVPVSKKLSGLLAQRVGGKLGLAGPQ